MEHSPSAYQQGYVKARMFNLAAADNYIKHTTIGDPVLDSVMEELSSLPPPDLHRFIKAGIELTGRYSSRCAADTAGFLR